ncbi:class I adenylate-forming enzyme family protein [Nocardioides sp.]|uniref:class I adenylate-forming enzyme family protein n=1 Tax=Nocardioides sp. TaxID=35761 RepID=UPI00378380FB
MSGVRDVAELVSAAAAEEPDRVALVEPGGRRTTWSQLEDEVARLATGLGLAGVVGGQRVLIAMGNRLEFVTTYLGVLRAQAVAVPVNPRSTVDELARMLDDSGSRVAVAEPATAAAVREAAGTLAAPPRVVVVGEPSYDDLRAAAAEPVPPLQDPEKLAALLYTSGTSGRPRAAMLTHRALLANVEQVAQVEPPMIHRDDVVLAVLPLFHVYGLNAVLGGTMQRRARLVLAERFDPSGTLALVEAEQCTVLPVAPPVFPTWEDQPDLRERLRSVRLVLSGSAPLSAEAVQRFSARTGIPVHQGYGLTEAAPVVTSTLCSAAPEPGSVGAALPGVELRLVDEGGRSPEGEDSGEIQVRGANLFSGYWPDGSGGPDAEGWWSTGDVGFLDDDGDLFLVDRLKELVIVSGFNVYPTEVEDVIAEVVGVDDVGVIGVEDPQTGEAVVAYVRADPASAPDPEALAAAVREHCARRLARFKQPSRVEVVDELPKTVTGKVQKGRLRGIERRRRSGLLE